ncbi:MAG: S8 family serine peptidase, partial [Candidatus Nanopelagicales bacterium]
MFQASSAQAGASSEAPSSGEWPVSGLIVKYEPGYSAASLGRDASLPTDVRQAVAPGSDIGFDMSTLTLAAPVSADEARVLARQLQASPGIALAEPDYTIQLDDGGGWPAGPANSAAAPQSVQDSPTWGLDRIDARVGLDQRYVYDTTGAGVKAYILDTGIRSTHVDFGGRVAPGASFVPDGHGTEDCAGHGTHVAGTVGGATYGVAKGVTLVPVRLGDCNSILTFSGIISGIRWAVLDHPYSAPAVMNISLGGGASTTFDTAVRAAIADNITVVVASGNDAIDACTQSPSRVEQAIAVNASLYPDAPAYFSNWGRCTDVYAPGWRVVSTGIESDTATSIMSGTSMATPHVAGVAARYLSVHPEATPAQVQAAIKSSATPVDFRPGTPEDAKGLLYSFAERWTTPDAPTNLLATAGVGSASIAFTSPSSDGGAPLSNYEYSIDDGASWVSRSPAATDSPVVIGGLTSGVTYRVRLRAVNAVGPGAASDAVVVSILQVPTAPEIFTVAPDNGSAMVWLLPPASDGGAAITNYTYSLDDGATWITRTPASTIFPLTITGLTNRTTYQMRFRA